MNFGRLPIMPHGKDVPVIVSDKWKKSDNSLVKTYRFISNELRNDFIRQLLIHEETVGHHAMMTIQHEIVILSLKTRDVEQVTELDKEYAKAADIFYKDVVYSLSNDI